MSPRRASGDAARFLRTVVHQSAGDLAAFRIDARDDRPALEFALDRFHADGQQALAAGEQGPRAPASSCSLPATWT